MNTHENYGKVNKYAWAIILTVALVIIGYATKAQTKTVISTGNPSQIYKYPALAMDSILYLPKGCGTPPLAANYQIAYRGPMIYMDTCNTVLYVYNPNVGAWGAIANAADLSAYLKIIDTSAMLGPYARTAVVNAQLALKLNLSDTAAMLAPYEKIVNSMGFVATVTELQSFGAASLLPNSNPLVVQVSDNKMGGIFNYYASGYTVDTALVYPATGMGGGYWVRQITDGKYYTAWWNIDSTQTSTNNQRRAKRMFDEAQSGWRIIFDRGNKLLFDSAVYVHGKDNLYVEGWNYNRDSSKTYLTNVTFDTCRRLTVVNSRFWGASALNTDAQRRSGLIIKNSDYFLLDNNVYSHYKKNGLEILFCSYGNGYNQNFDSCSRDGISLSPAQYCNFYNCTNQNSALGGMEFSDSTNHCGLFNYTSINTLYVFDKDYHIAGQSNSDNIVDGFTAINCGAVIDHGTPATSTVVEKNWKILNGTVIGGTGATGHGDFFWATNTQNVIFQNIVIRRPQYTGQAVFQISNTDGLVFDNILFDDSLNNNPIRCTGGGPFALQYANGITVTNCQARDLKSTTSGTFAVSVDMANHVKILGNTFTGIPTYGGNGVSIGTINDLTVANNTSDSMPNGFGVSISASIACNGGFILNNYSRTTQRDVNFSGTNNAGYTVANNIGPNSGAGLQTNSQAYPYRIDNGFYFDPRARSLSLGNVISQGGDTSYTLYLVSNQKTNIAGFFYDPSHGMNVKVLSTGSVEFNGTSGGQTFTVGFSYLYGSGISTNTTNFGNANLAIPTNNGTFTGISTAAVLMRSMGSGNIQTSMIARGATAATITAGENVIDKTFGQRAYTMPSSGAVPYAIGIGVRAPAITPNGTSTLALRYAAGLDTVNGNPGGGQYGSLWAGGNVFVGGLMQVGSLTSPTNLTANQIFVANTAGTAMTGATVEQLNVPKVVASAILTGQTATTNIVTYTTGAADSTFDISGRLTITAYTSGNVQLTVNYTDETSTSRTGTFYPMGSATAALSAAGASNFPVMGSIRVKASTTITVIATVSGTLTFTGAAKIIKLP